MTFLIQSNLWLALTHSSLAIFLQLNFHGRIDRLGTVFFFILVWQIFTLDRYFIFPEDQEASGLNIARFISRHRQSFQAALIGSFLTLLLIFLNRPILIVGYFLVLMGGFFYIFPLWPFKKRLKKISYLKSFYVPFVGIISLLFSTHYFPQSAGDALIYLLLYILFMLNISLFDLKDVKGDAAAGIKTFASKWGLTRLVWIEFLISIFLGTGLVIWSSTPPFLALGITFLIYGLAALNLFKIKLATYLFTAIDGTSAVALITYLLL